MRGEVLEKSERRSHNRDRLFLCTGWCPSQIAEPSGSKSANFTGACEGFIAFFPKGFGTIDFASPDGEYGMDVFATDFQIVSDVVKLEFAFADFKGR